MNNSDLYLTHFLMLCDDQSGVTLSVFQTELNQTLQEFASLP